MKKNNNKGFTLIEALIALILSAFIVFGTYSMFSSIIKTKEITEKNNEQNMMLLSLKKLVKNDMLQLFSDTVKIDNTSNTDDGNAYISFTTNNSIKLEKAVPVTVTYYVENGWLMRKEQNLDLNYEWTLKLLPNISKFQILTDKGSEFSETYSKTDTIFQFVMKYNDDQTIKFVAGCGLASQESITNGTSSSTSSTSSSTTNNNSTSSSTGSTNSSTTTDDESSTNTGSASKYWK